VTPRVCLGFDWLKLSVPDSVAGRDMSGDDRGENHQAIALILKDSYKEEVSTRYRVPAQGSAVKGLAASVSIYMAIV